MISGGTGGNGGESRMRRHEGKAKVVFEGPEPGTLLLEFKDEATAFDGKKRDTIPGKGPLNRDISAALFRYLEERGIPTHFLRSAGEREMVVRELRMIPLEVVVRNIAAGSLSRRLGLPEGEELPFPVVELYWKNDSLGDPLVNDSHVAVLGLASQEELAEMRRVALEVNRLLLEFFRERGMILVDFKLEFGRGEAGRIVLGDELSPDTCRLWDARTREILDKDRFRRDLGGLIEAYAEVRERIR